jgi:hypothetical protein
LSSFLFLFYEEKNKLARSYFASSIWQLLGKYFTVLAGKSFTITIQKLLTLLPHFFVICLISSGTTFPQDGPGLSGHPMVATTFRRVASITFLVL